MARCDVPGCDWRGKKAGLPIHKAVAHDIHPVHDVEILILADDWLEIQACLERLTAEGGVRCPVPGCPHEVKDLEGHLEAEHEDWRLSDGRWVFEA